jgi:hypothetical protein
LLPADQVDDACRLETVKFPALPDGAAVRATSAVPVAGSATSAETR